jgi:15-cis-phytoene synthase
MPENFSYCEGLVREEDRDRFLATLFAPAAARPALYAIYAFDIEIGHIATRVREPLAGEVRLQWWHDVITGPSREQAAGSPVAAALIETIERHALPQQIFVDQIDAQRDALYRKPVEAMDQFEDWARKTEGGIVALAARILSGGDAFDHASAHAGVALACARAASPSNTQDYRELAERHLGKLRAMLPPAASNVSAAFLLLALVRPTLEAIAKNGAPLPQWRRQWILWRASRNLAKWI